MIEAKVPSRRGGEILDLCRGCRCVWFDATELESVVATDAKKPVSRSLEPQLHDERLEVARLKIAALAEAHRVRQEGAPPSPEGAFEWSAFLFGLPLLDQGKIERQPLVTFFAIIALAIFGVATLFVGVGPMADLLGFVPARWTESYGLTLLSSFFVHAGIFHLVSNVYFLFLVGPGAEDVLGHGKLLALLVLATAAGGVAHALVDPASNAPCVGASGGISGVMAFLALTSPLAKMNVLMTGGGFGTIMRRVRIPAIGAFSLWLVIQLFTLGDQIDGQVDVSAAAHLGGVLVGVLFWAIHRYR